jgi:GNAT superfamily N-acetyltransferase
VKPPPSVRPARQADARVLAQLRYEFRAAIGTVEEPEKEFLVRCEEWMCDRLAGDTWRAWIAEDEGVGVGTIWLQFLEKIPNPIEELEWHGYITSLYVREPYRGRGTGSTLLAAALDGCRKREVDAVILWPTPRSRALYERHGLLIRDDIMELRQ